MTRIVVHSRVGADGVLHLAVPLGAAAADEEVQVIIGPVPKPAMTQEEWRQFVLSTAGAWQGELERPPQGEYEQRDEMIACIALVGDLTVVSHNTSEFSRVPGLKLEDWQ